MSTDQGLEQEDVGRATVEYRTAFRKNGMMPFAATWTDLESPSYISLSEVSQTKKYQMTSLICGI